MFFKYLKIKLELLECNKVYMNQGNCKLIYKQQLDYLNKLYFKFQVLLVVIHRLFGVRYSLQQLQNLSIFILSCIGLFECTVV